MIVIGSSEKFDSMRVVIIKQIVADVAFIPVTASSLTNLRKNVSQ